MFDTIVLLRNGTVISSRGQKWLSGYGTVKTVPYPGNCRTVKTVELVAPSTEYKCMKCKTNNLILLLTPTLTLMLTLTDPVTPYFIRPLLNFSDRQEERNWVRGLGVAKQLTYIALYCGLYLG